jgi:hypothetical protein
MISASTKFFAQPRLIIPTFGRGWICGISSFDASESCCVIIVALIEVFKKFSFGDVIINEQAGKSMPCLMPRLGNPRKFLQNPGNDKGNLTG